LTLGLRRRRKRRRSNNGSISGAAVLSRAQRRGWA